MTTSTSTSKLSYQNSYAVADEINAAVKAGHTVVVNGRTLFTAYGNPATTWMNGTVSFRVPAKAKGRVNDIYVKTGERIVIDITVAA